MARHDDRSPLESKFREPVDRGPMELADHIYNATDDYTT